jgi:hypothetical protein
MLDSLLPQLQPNDHLTVVFDGKKDIPTSFQFAEAKCHLHLKAEFPALKFWGHGIRNKYARLLEKTDFVLHADDDDIYLPDTFQYLRDKCRNFDTLYIARMWIGSTLSPSHDDGNVGTPCGIIPHQLNSKAKWQELYGGDGDFYSALKRQAKSIQHLREKPIYQVFQKESAWNKHGLPSILLVVFFAVLFFAYTFFHKKQT